MFKCIYDKMDIPSIVKIHSSITNNYPNGYFTKKGIYTHQHTNHLIDKEDYTLIHIIYMIYLLLHINSNIGYIFETTKLFSIYFMFSYF